MHIRVHLVVSSLLALAGSLQAGPRVSIGIGFGMPCYRPCYRPAYLYAPYPVFVPPPVYYAPAPVILAPVAPVAPGAPVAPVVQTEAATTADPVAQSTPPASIIRAARPVSTTGNLESLNDPDPRSRADAIVQIGRSRDGRAIGPLSQLLQADGNPEVREAAARALGLIGSAEGLPALQRAASADPQRDVRKTASFAADVIRASLRR